MKKIVFGILCLGLWSAASMTTAKSADAMVATEPETIQAAQPTYQQGAFYVRMKSVNAPKLKSGERKVSVNRLASLASLREAYSVHETMQSMRVFDNAELARTFLVEFDDIEKSEELLAKLAAMPEVEMVERVPAYFITASMPKADDETPNDPFYGTINGANFSWHLDLIHAEDAWKMQQSDSNIVVAVVDNAIWGNHPDLQIPASRQYNVRDGKVGNSAPPASVSQNTQCSSINACDIYLWSHGTHCAGAVGAIKNNGIGIASMGSGVSVMGVSCPSNTVGAVQNAFAGITYAAENGARVISTSWGGYSISNTERAIVQACIDKGIVMVSAAGNDNRTAPFYPANLPGVISIGSVNSDKSMSSFSNFGEWVMLAAPGGFVSNSGKESNLCIFSTTYCQSQRYRLHGVNGVTGEYYDGMFGTSMATPVTSGLCGFLLSADSTLTPYLLREILMASAQKIEGSNKPIQPGSGIIDAVAALDLIKSRKPMPRNLTAVREERSRTMRLAWQAPEEGKVKSYRIYVNGTMKAEVEDTVWSEDVSKTSNLYHYGVAAVFEDGSVSLRDCRDVYVPELGAVTITVRPAGCGSVTPENGYYIQKEDTLRLVATPVNGCKFARWMESGSRLGSDSILNYVVGFDSVSIEAVFTGSPVATEKTTSAGSLKIYPNPTRETLFVESSDEIYRTEVYSLGGIRLLELSSAAGTLQVELNVGRFAEGMYLLKVFGKNGVSIEKFLIKK